MRILRALLLPLVLTGCTYDFEDYTPRFTDASTDTRVVADTAVQDSAPVDVGCTPSNAVMCYTTVKTCVAKCTTTRAMCEGMCGSANCRKDCRDAEAPCRSACITDCNNCTAMGGCLTSARCASEAG